MDYCSSCRRHLNGALVCPGCGAYAPDIAPPMAMAAPGADAVPDHDTWQDTRPPVREPLDDGPAEAVAAASPGRAARRRQRARWKKNQRKALVATAVALVGGGLTVASLDGRSGDRAQATTAPDNRAMGSREEEPTEAADPTEPTASTPSRTPETRATTPEARPSSPTSAPREQSISVAPRATPTTAEPRAPKAPAPSATAGAQSQQVSPGNGNSNSDVADTAPEPAATPTPPAATTPSPSATEPSGQVCVLVLCLG